MKKALLIAGGIIVLPIAWYLISPIFIVIEKNEPSPIPQASAPVSPAALPVVLAESQFVPKAHDVSGKAILIDDNGKKIIRFEDFETINGPDVFIWLSKDLAGDDYVDLGRIKATKGSVNYEVPEGADLSQYNKVLVWCRAFSVLFSYADLGDTI